MNRPPLIRQLVPSAVLLTALVIFSGCGSSGNKGKESENPAGKIPPAKVGPSGVPEVMIRVRDEATLREGITDFFLGRGYAEGESRFTDELVFDRPSGPSETARTAARVRLRYTRRAEGVWRVVATPLAVESWKSALEAEHAVVSASAQMQGFLNHIKARIEPKL